MNTCQRRSHAEHQPPNPSAVHHDASPRRASAPAWFAAASVPPQVPPHPRWRRNRTALPGHCSRAGNLAAVRELAPQPRSVVRAPPQRPVAPAPLPRCGPEGRHERAQQRTPPPCLPRQHDTALPGKLRQAPAPLSAHVDGVKAMRARAAAPSPPVRLPAGRDGAGAPPHGPDRARRPRGRQAPHEAGDASGPAASAPAESAREASWMPPYEPGSSHFAAATRTSTSMPGGTVT